MMLSKHRRPYILWMRSPQTKWHGSVTPTSFLFFLFLPQYVPFKYDGLVSQPFWCYFLYLGVICSVLRGSLEPAHFWTCSQNRSEVQVSWALAALSSTSSTLSSIIHIHQTLPPLAVERKLSPVETVMQQEQPMLIETLVAECKLDHSGSFVHGMASVW